MLGDPSSEVLWQHVQVVKRQGCGSAIDLWSLGAVLAELALHRPLFPAHSPKQLLQQVHSREAAEISTSLSNMWGIDQTFGASC